MANVDRGSARSPVCMRHEPMCVSLPEPELPVSEPFKRVVLSQFEASLCMLRDCIASGSVEHWDGIIGRYPVQQMAYHTLCFVDAHLSLSDEKW